MHVDIPEPNSCCCGRFLHRPGVSAWSYLATGEGRCPPLCGPNTDKCNRESLGALLAQPTKGKERGVGW